MEFSSCTLLGGQIRFHKLSYGVQMPLPHLDNFKFQDILHRLAKKLKPFYGSSGIIVKNLTVKWFELPLAELDKWIL